MPGQNPGDAGPAIALGALAWTALGLTEPGHAIGALALGTYSLRGEMQTIIEQLPEAATKPGTE